MNNSRLQRLLKDKASEHERHRQQIDYLNREIEREKETLKSARQYKKDQISPEQQAWQNSFDEEATYDLDEKRNIKELNQKLKACLSTAIDE